MALSSNSIFIRILLTFRFPTFTLKVTGEKYERHNMWQERFCGFYIRHPQKTKKRCSRKKKIPQKFNMSLTSELSKVSPDYEIHCPTHNCHALLASRLNICHILDIASPYGDFSPIVPNSPFSQIYHFH